MSLPQGYQYQIAQVNLATLNQPITVRTDTTSPEVAAEFNTWFQSFGVLFNKPSTVSSTGVVIPAVVTGSDVTDIKNAITQLTNLAVNGINGYPLNSQMASALDNVLRSLKSVGWDGNPASLNLTQLQDWKDLSITSSTIGSAIRNGLDSFAGNKSIQALIELEYVGTANQLVEDKMGDLEQALTTTSDALNTLAVVQNLHNKILFTSKKPFTFNYTNSYGNDPGNYLASYRYYASAYFNDNIKAQVPTDLWAYTTSPVNYTSYYLQSGVKVPVQANNNAMVFTAAGQSAFDQLLKVKQSLLAQIARLSSILTDDQKQNSGNLYSSLKKVVADMDAGLVDRLGNPITFSTDQPNKFFAFQNWLTDKYNNRDDSSAGDIQQGIQKAIAAGQSLNDTQKQDVSNYLFVFEEYYKSASSILQTITQIIQKMAQGIRS